MAKGQLQQCAQKHRWMSASANPKSHSEACSFRTKPAPCRRINRRLMQPVMAELIGLVTESVRFILSMPNRNFDYSKVG